VIETPARVKKPKTAVKRLPVGQARAQLFSSIAQTQRRSQPMEFGIVRAHLCRSARESARQLIELDFPGYAVGGPRRPANLTEFTCERRRGYRILPKERIRYLMGVGRPNKSRLRRPRHRHDGLCVPS